MIDRRTTDGLASILEALPVILVFALVGVGVTFGFVLYVLWEICSHIQVMLI